MSRGIDMWGDPPPCADDLELSGWIARCLGGETAILDLLRAVAAGELGTGVVRQLAVELAEDGAEPIDPWLLTDGLVIAGHNRLAHGLRRRLGLITKRGKRVRR